MQADVCQCFDSWAHELKSRSDRVRNLIGSVHWLSDGHHKEEIFRQFLIRHLPPRLRVTRGFIKPATSEDSVSREIDIMVTDSEAELPWFAEGDLIIAPPSSVMAQIHIKTEFAAQELADVLLAGAHNQGVFESAVANRTCWFGAAFFSATVGTTAKALQNVWRSAIKIVRKEGVACPHLPDCVIIVDGPVFLMQANAATDGKNAVRAFDCGQAAAAVFLSHLSDSVPLPGKDSTRRGEWFQMITRVCKGTLFMHKI